MRPVALVLLLGACVDRRLVGEDPVWQPWPEGETEERVRVRVATWNVLELGEPEAFDFEAMVRVIQRLDPDVLVLNEVQSNEGEALQVLADRLGYDTVLQSEDPLFGETGNAMLARLPLLASSTPDGAALSGDPDARDLTRRPVVARFEVPGTTATLGVVGQHWKSGFADVDVFRRAIDGLRTAQAVAGLDDSLVLALGDVNAEPTEQPVPARFDELPDDLPGSFNLGADLRAQLQGPGIDSKVYTAMEAVGFSAVDAAQRDGTAYTRPESERRIDIAFANAATRAAGLRAEVYDSRDDLPDQPGLADAGERPEPTDVARASDHLPVLVELRVR